MNNICVAGQIGQDAELKFLSDGTPVANFSVADNQGRDKPTVWWRMQLFGKRAESLSQYLTKGQSVTVTGTVTQREYTDRDGIKKMAQEVRVQDVALQGGQRQQSEAPAPTPRPASNREQNRERQYAAAKPTPNFSDMDEDIPF